MATNVAMSRGMISTTIQAPSANLVTVSVSSTMAVTTAPTPFTHMRHRHPVSFRRSQRQTIPLCENVKEMKTPTMYNGKATISRMANALRIRIPLEKTSRSPWLENWRGM